MKQCKISSLQNILAEAKAKNAKDIHVDFEYLRTEDRQSYVDFLKRLKAAAMVILYQLLLLRKHLRTKPENGMQGMTIKK